MSRPRAGAHEASQCRKGDTGAASRAGAATSLNRRAAEPRSRQPVARYLRQHAVALSLIGMLAMIAIPPTVATSSGPELIATGALTLVAGVLLALICAESRRRSRRSAGSRSDPPRG
jgi:hypothetical protein